MKLKWITLFVMLLVLSACSGRQSFPEQPTLDETALNQTAVSQATLDFEAMLAQEPMETPAPSPTKTPIPTIDRTRPPVHTPTPEGICDRAAAGNPIDVTIPDDTLMAPGESFSKTWRLRNAGICTWTRLYALTFFSGNSMKAIQTHYLVNPVEPGDVIELTVDMEAPQLIGVYQGNWMLRNTAGELFGIGPYGDAPFWVRIEVVAQLPATPSPSPTVTRTPSVHVEGDVDLRDGDRFDLDTGTLNPVGDKKPDLQYQYGGSPAHILTPLNGTRWVVLGEEEPTFKQCVDASLTENAIHFNHVPVGTYICYRTSDALPGWLLMEGFAAGELSVSFLTWFVP